jgi:CubicO group peptidase (beta-lactamase class C family)
MPTPSWTARRSRLRTLALAAAIAAIPYRAPAQAGAATALPAPNAATFTARVDSTFARWSGTDRPGCAVGVSNRDGVLLERAYGMADLESGVPMLTTSIFHAASLAKQVTALSVLLLARDGKLGLDDDVRRWLPELPDYRPRYAAPITVRQLLSHTSGLRDFFELLILARGRFEEDRITEADALAVVARQQALNFSPGTEYGYSNSNYLLAARLVERVSGQSFGAFAAQRIFTPLGMTRTRIRDDVATLVPGRALGYSRAGAGWRANVQNYDVVGPTNLLTTVGDLLRWSANLERPAVGDSALVRQMRTPTVLPDGDTTLYGLGLSLGRDRGASTIEHEGRDPGFRAYLGRYVDSGVAVALLCNTTALDPVGLGHDVAGLYLGLPPQRPMIFPRPATAAPAPDPRRALEWAGVYVEPTTRRVVELTVRDGVLYTDRVGGARIDAIGERRGWLVNGPLVLEFGAGRHPSYRLRSAVPGRRARDVFEWRAPAAPTLDRSALAAYAGSYTSAELESTYHVEVADSTIVLHTGTSPGLTARPVFPDGFVSGQYTIEFRRVRGRVTGFEISHPRALGVRFSRDAR